MENPTAYGLIPAPVVDPGFKLAVFDRPEANQRLVNGRDLHEWLEVPKKYTDWIKYKIGQHRFQHGTDYVRLEAAKEVNPKNGKNLGGRPVTEYALSLDAAKMVAMGTNNRKGDEVKRVFLMYEKIAIAALSSPDFTLAPNATVTEWLPGLEEHTAPKFQREQAQRLQRLLRERGGVNAVIKHGRGACLSQTGLGAREIMQLGQAVGLPAKNRTSAREVLRHMAPAVACSMSLYDTLAQFGTEPEAAGKVAAKAQEVFHDLLQLGTYPVELVPFQRFIG